MINLSDKAKAKVKELFKEQGKAASFLRVAAKGGGCSGMTYDVKIDDALKEQDRMYMFDDVQVVCDTKSLVYLDGMSIDYSTELVGAGFKFVNPKATGSCGCGTSFST